MAGIAVLTLFVALIGSTFAYFTAVVQGNDTAEETHIGSATISVSYSDGAEIKVNDAVPGWNANKEITVTNNSTTNITYSILWQEVSNTFVNSLDNDCVVNSDGTKIGCNEQVTNQEFYYTYQMVTTDNKVTTDQNNNIALPYNNGTYLVKDVTLAPGKKDTYTISFNFANLVDSEENGVSISGNQNANQNATFTAKLQAVVNNVTYRN